MKILFTLLISVFILNGGTTLKDVREAFRVAEKTKDDAAAFNKLMSNKLDIDENLKIAYYGASETMLAKHGTSISESVGLFKSGKGYIEIAVKNSPSNVEIRLVRLMIQHNAPSILGYHSDIDEDKAFIIDHFNSISTSLKAYIKRIARETDVFTADQKAILISK